MSPGFSTPAPKCGARSHLCFSGGQEPCIFRPEYKHMEILPVEEAQWVHKEVKCWPPEDFRREGTTVENLVPPMYESYGKILHPFELNAEEPDTLEPHPNYGKQVSIAITHTPDGGISITEQKPDGTVVDLGEEARQREEGRQLQTLVHTSWQSLAQKYGLTYHAEINTASYAALFQQTGWPRNLLFPSEGFLPRTLLTHLLSLLRQHTPHDEVYIYQWPPHSIFKEGRAADLVRCSFAEVLEYFDGGFTGYLYAGDRSWLVHTNTDFHFTLVGGSKDLLEALKSSDLEVLECSAATRVDDYSDRINEPPPPLPTTPPPHQELRPSRMEKEPFTLKRHSIFNRFLRWLTGK